MQQHINSKKVTIFRAGSFALAAQTGAQEFMSMSKKSIGSYFQSSTSKGIGSGLNFDEIDALMPLVLDVPKEDRTFRAEVKKYFMEMVTKIPADNGLELEIGLLVDNSKPIVTKDKEGNITLLNLPINISDYIRYRHALGHPKVALSISAAKGNTLIDFYVFDKEIALSQDVDAAKDKDDAIVAYLKIKEDEDKVNMMLTLLKVDPRTYKGKNAADQKEQKLRELADKNATAFLKVYKQDNFEQRYQIKSMVNTGILKEIGSQIVDAETGDVIGHNFEEAVYFLRDVTKSQTVSILKARMQEALKGTISRVKNTPAPAKEPAPADE